MIKDAVRSVRYLDDAQLFRWHGILAMPARDKNGTPVVF